MKQNKIFVFGLLAVVLTFCFAFIGCKETSGSGGGGSGEPDFNGTWTNNPYSIEINGTNYTMKNAGVNLSQGTFTKTGTTSGNVTFTMTDLWNSTSSSWTSTPGTAVNGTWSFSGNDLIINGLAAPFAVANGTWIKQ